MIILILIAIITIFLIVILIRANKQNPTPVQPRKVNKDLECCGMHDVCEAETLLTLSEEIIYFDDEELDQHKNKNLEDYSTDEIDEFRTILLELQRHEVSGWLKSLQLRKIPIPDPIREEALMIIEEFKQIRAKNK